MKSSLAKTCGRARRLLTALLLVAVLSSFAAAVVKSHAPQAAGTSAPASVSSAVTLLSDHAVTTRPGQRLASDASKQNRLRHSLIYAALTPRVGLAATAVKRFLVTPEQSVSYLSFRLSRTGGRAPPVSA
jgi:Tfp pilus assembly protein FimT